MIVIVIVLGVFAIVRGSRNRRSTTADPSPRQGLDRRYAAGEIDRDEYVQRREDLDS